MERPLDDLLQSLSNIESMNWQTFHANLENCLKSTCRDIQLQAYRATAYCLCFVRGVPLFEAPATSVHCQQPMLSAFFRTFHVLRVFNTLLCFSSVSPTIAPQLTPILRSRELYRPSNDVKVLDPKLVCRSGDVPVDKIFPPSAADGCPPFLRLLNALSPKNMENLQIAVEFLRT